MFPIQIICNKAEFKDILLSCQKADSCKDCVLYSKCYNMDSLISMVTVCEDKQPEPSAKQASAFVSVKDALPENDVTVLTRVARKDHADYFAKNRYLCKEGEWLIKPTGTITHWIPFPSDL